MKASRIPAHEASFLNSGKAINGRTFELSPFEVSIGNTSESIDMVRARVRNGDESFYYNTSVNKDRIVIHFTAGYLKGDMSALSRPNFHVSVPFVIARDGTVYNLWPSSRWSYHLGKGALGGNQAESRRSIGIELSNIGPLINEDGKLYSTYKDPNGNYFDVYCNESETQYYQELEDPYRKHTFYATYTDIQYEKLDQVIRYLSARYSIPYTLLPEEDRYDVKEENLGAAGVLSHVNYRRSGKWDIGPAFDWSKLTGGS